MKSHFKTLCNIFSKNYIKFVSYMYVEIRNDLIICQQTAEGSTELHSYIQIILYQKYQKNCS